MDRSEKREKKPTSGTLGMKEEWKEEARENTNHRGKIDQHREKKDIANKTTNDGLSREFQGRHRLTTKKRKKN